MSLSRPDPSSPTSIADASFGTSRRGFDQAEVRDFLRMVAAEFGRLRERERFLERELQTAQAEGQRGAVDEATMTQLLGEEAIRVLTTARESANEIREKAEQAAAQLLHEAAEEAGRAREEADIEASRRRADAAADAEAELSMAKQQGREMVNEARAYRERVLSELARRRELAREQIEQLIHGRDRLMQVFERARLVAVDVVAEMQPLGEPGEYVNLTPTTGPLPVMIANSARPDETGGGAAESSDSDAADAVAPVADVAEPTDSESSDSEGSVDSAGALRIVEDAGTADAEPSKAAATIREAEVVHGVDDDVAVTVGDATDGDATDGDASDADDGDAMDADAGGVAEGDGDVVVDLFARLRADTNDDSSEHGKSDAAAQGDDVGTDVTTGSDETDTAEDAETEVSDDVADDAADLLGPTVFERRDEVITPLIVSSAKKLKRALADEQNDVLDALRRSDEVRALDALLPPEDEHAARYTQAIAHELLEAVHEGSTESRTINRKLRKALVTEAASSANDAVIDWLVMPLRERLARCISEGDGDNAVVTKKVRAVYREWKTQRIDESLDDVIRCAHGRGVLAGFDDEAPVVWAVDSRFAACADCDDNVLAGAVAAGEPFPTGDSFAPAHQGCRCLLVAEDR